MATTVDTLGPRAKPLGTDTYEKILAVGAVVLGLAMVAATAALSFRIHVGNPGGYSVIHPSSAWTLVQVPLIWWTARTRKVVRHRRAVRGMVTGALLVAGFFTFPFHRLLGMWLFG